MEVLNALKNLLVGAIPTFLLVWILYLYVTRVFLRPLEITMRKRREETVGLRQTAEAALAEAEKKTAKYQEALRSAKAEIYHIQEQERQRALEQRAEIVRQARQRAEEMANSARQQIHEDAENAKKTLASEAETLAVSITRVILRTAPHASHAGGSEIAP